MKKFYYYRDRQSRPIVTVCLMAIDGVISKGIAVCSLKDNPCKDTGRKLAEYKALRAFKKKKSGCILRRYEAWAAVETTGATGLHGQPKSHYDVKEFTEFEEKLLPIVNEHIG